MCFLNKKSYLCPLSFHTENMLVYESVAVFLPVWFMSQWLSHYLKLCDSSVSIPIFIPCPLLVMVLNNCFPCSPESAPKAFSIPLSQVIANDRAYKRRQDALKESRRDCLDLEASILHFRAEKRQFFNGNKPLGSSSSITGVGPGSPSANSVHSAQHRKRLRYNMCRHIVQKYASTRKNNSVPIWPSFPPFV